MSSSNILVLNGSPRNGGIVAGFTAALQQAAEGTLVINAYQQDISPCTDCRYCKSHSECIIPDMNGLYDMLEKADVLVVASPVYNGGLPSPLKCIIDRFQPYYYRRVTRNEPKLKPKKSFLFLCSGQHHPETAKHIETWLNRLGTVINTQFKDTLYIGNTDQAADLSGIPDFIQRIKEATTHE